MYSWASKVSKKYVCSRCGEAVKSLARRTFAWKLENTQISEIHSEICEEKQISQEVSDKQRADVIIAEQKI